MVRMNIRRFNLCAAVLCVLAAASVTAQAARVEVHPKDTGEALINPDMGWTLHYYSNSLVNYGSRLEPADTASYFPGLSVVYLRLPWSLLEPEEGLFDWSVLDTPAQRFIREGKQIALRLTTAETPFRFATPSWVREAGAKGYFFTPHEGIKPDGTHWEPDYDDPIFIEKLDKFLEAMAKRYDGNPAVAFIDVGTYGTWGEGHTVHSTQIKVPDEVKKLHIDLHLKHFKKTLLCINDDFIGHNQPGDDFPVTNYALSKSVSLRDDSIMSAPNAKPPWYHDQLAQKFWPTLPVILEHAHYGSALNQKKSWSNSLLIKSVEDYHASYMSIHWWPDEFLHANRTTIDQINRRLGYRLQLRQASWPGEVTIGEPFTFRSVWRNAGVAPCYPGGFVTLTIMDDKGGIVSVNVDESFSVRELPVGPPGEAEERTLESKFVIGRRIDDRGRMRGMKVLPGTYGVYVSVGRRDGTPVIALPHNGEYKNERRYLLGKIEVSLSPSDTAWDRSRLLSPRRK